MTLADRNLKVLKASPMSPLENKLRQIRINAKKVELRLYRLFGGQIINFLHIPKTGGSALKHALKAAPETDAYRIHLRGHSCRLTDIPAGDKFFFTLRDPAQRFVSAFNHKKAGRSQWQHTKIEAETAALKHFETANHLAESLFSKDLKTRQAAEIAMNSIEHVNTFYLDWFVSKEYFLSRVSDAMYIAFQETLETDFAQIKKVLGLPEISSLPVLNSAKANKNPQSLETKLSVRAKDNLARWYADDYDFLAFCKDLAVEINARSLAA
jgi:hypothetical protein